MDALDTYIAQTKKDYTTMTEDERIYEIACLRYRLAMIDQLREAMHGG